MSCSTSTFTLFQDAVGISSVMIASDSAISLSVLVVESDSFECSLSFTGRDDAASVFSGSLEGSASDQWALTIVASQPSSSANSQIFFSDANELFSQLYLFGPMWLLAEANAKCVEELAVVTCSLPAGWTVSDEGAHRVVLETQSSGRRP